MHSPVISPLAAQHIEQVSTIERNAHSHPWSQAMLSDVNSRGACHHVLTLGEQVIGYFYAQNIVGEVTLLNIAVDPNWQGKGYGQQLMAEFLAMCEKSKAESAWLEVRASNSRALHLYESLGFNQVDRRRGYYPTISGKKEDAIIMSYPLPT